MSTLWELTDKIKWLEDSLEAAEDGATEYGTAEQIAAYLDDTSKERDNKLDAYAWLLKKFESELAACDAQVYEWTCKRDVRRRRVDHMKEALKAHMEIVGAKKITTMHFAFSLCGNGGPAPLDIDETQVPEEFFDPQPPKLNRYRLQDTWKVTQNIPGVEEQPRGKHVRVR